MLEQPPPYSWYTTNIIENKIFAWLIVLFYNYLPFGTNLVSATSNNNDNGGLISILQDYIIYYSKQVGLFIYRHKIYYYVI